MSRTIFKKSAIAAFYLIIWQGAAMAVGSPLLFPSPIETISALATLCVTAAFWQSVGLTLIRVTAGFALGIMAGCVLGVVTAISPLANEVLSPLRSIIKATPVTSFIILVLLWLTTGLTPVFTAFIMVAPLAWANVREGILAVDPLLIEMGRAFRLSRKKLLVKLYLPGILPQLTAACATGIGFAWKAGVAAEVIARPEFSMGKSIIESKLYMEIPQLFAWTAAVVALSMIFEALMLRGLRRLGHDRA